MEYQVRRQLGNYRLQRLLGRGSFAEVYLGEHIYLHKLSAIKVLHSNLGARAIRDFTREAQVISSLKHPHILHVDDFGFEQNVPFLVMEYAERGSLRDLHERGKILSPTLVTAYSMLVARALQYAHNHGLIHRDVKPENMLVRNDGNVLLGDFGIVAVAHNRMNGTYPGAQERNGTAHYMAPEQIEGHPQPASDQYSLAICVYEWLSGELPFGGTSLYEVMMNHLRTEPVPLSHLVPSIPRAVEQVVMRGLARDPQQRYPGVLEFAQALETALGGPQSTPVEPTVYSERSDSLKSTTRTPVPPRNKPLAAMLNQKAAPTLDSQLHTFRPRYGSPQQVSWSPDGKYLVATSAKMSMELWSSGFEMWDVVSKSRHLAATYVASVSWSPDSSLLATGSKFRGVNIYNVKSASMVREDITGPRMAQNTSVLSWSPNGRLLAVSGERAVEMRETSMGNVVALYQDQEQNVISLSWSPDSRYLVGAFEDQLVRIWEAASGNQLYIYQGHQEQVKAVAWSPLGTHIASTDVNGVVRVWDVVNNQDVWEYHGYAASKPALAWSPDGQKIASGGDCVMVSDVHNGQVLYAYQGHKKEITSLCWSPDGQYIASASLDGTVQMWKAE